MLLNFTKVFQMSSNIKVQRICQHCGKEFTAKTTTTKYCSHTCNSRAYKAKKRAEKVKKSDQETIQVKTQPIAELNAKQILTVKEAAALLGFSVRTTYRLINNGTIKAVNLSERLTRIKRAELDKLLTPPEPTKPTEPEEPTVKKYDIEECYTLLEVIEKYNISRNLLQITLERNNIPKFKKGSFVYVPQVLIDQVLKDIH